MRPHLAVGVPLLFIALGSGWTTALGGDSPAELALNQKGLTKAGHTWVIEDEKPVLDKMKEVRTVFNTYAKAADKQAAAEDAVVQSAMLAEQRAELQANIAALNQQIQAQNSSMGSGRYGRMARAMGPSPLQIQHQQATSALSQTTAMQNNLKSQMPSAKDKAAIDDEVKKKGELFKSALSELRPEFDKVTKKYADLGADESVKKSMADLRKATKADVKLGPSETFLAASKELDQAERRFLGKKATTAASAKKKATTTTKKKAATDNKKNGL